MYGDETDVCEDRIDVQDDEIDLGGWINPIGIS